MQRAIHSLEVKGQLVEEKLVELKTLRTC